MDKKKKRFYVRTVILAILVAAIAFTVYTTATKDTVPLLKVGAEAPDFSLVDLDGETHRLSDYKGKGVLLNFWGTWCKPCKKEMPAINSQYNAFKDQGIAVLSINQAQTVFEVENFTDSFNLDFPVVIDKTKSVTRTYNVNKLPASVFIDPEGKVVRVYEGEMTEKMLAEFFSSIKPK
ncbi:thiol-disulfide oxidoreductase ResA [Viridibacillus sp. YIM B01967]|uniref:Thiol-disulfide oxidoreductase ResA n=1 Tax=Viridibacillus soli TaxID=2798301 RepID=A0ABS1H5E5_9BACL|nr:thiol-disulfide oxidoreductase ResA [Viridibacillus soli]MBK3494268.1 thiol-disulfide oxidoreductase ResA [Viridibacillus soli]